VILPTRSGARPTPGGRTGSRRLGGVDAARALALLGMMAVHVVPTSDDDGVTLAHTVAGGRASALFAVLAGVGISLASGGPRPHGGERLAAARRAVAARAGVVAAVGLTLAAFAPTPIAIILPYYGVLFLVALPVLGWRARPLLVAALVSVLVTPVLSHALRLSLPSMKGPSTSWGDLVLAPVDTVVLLLVSGYYPVLTWTAYLFLGLAVGRMRLTETAVAARLVWMGALLAVGAWAVGQVTVAAVGAQRLSGELTGTARPDLDVVLQTWLFGTTPTTSWTWLGVQAPHLGSGPDLAHTAGSALVVVGMCLLVVPPVGVLARPFVAAGSMTLTLYSVHVLVVAASDGAAWANAHPQVVLACHGVVALAAATLWGSPQRRGPLEQLAHAAARTAARRRPADRTLPSDPTGAGL
jgi:uncharacterized membrane protein